MLLVEAAAAADQDGAAEATPFFYGLGFKRPHLSYRAPSEYFAMYNLSEITLPVHPNPAPSAPAISFSHTCQRTCLAARPFLAGSVREPPARCRPP